jgi:type IV pilus assembly protein PilM
MEKIFKNPIGLDISDFKIRLFQLEKKAKTKHRVAGYSEIQVPNELIIDGEIKNPREVTKLISSALTHPLMGKFTSHYVNASISEKKIFLKKIEIPNVPREELKGAIRWGIEQNIPISVDQSYYDWKILAPTAKATDKIQAVVVASPKQTIDVYTECIQQCGLKLVSIENESSAIARCIVNPAREYDLTIILDLGKSRSTIIINDSSSVQYSNVIDINGKMMTDIIAQQLKLNETDAEKAKIICGLDKQKAKGSIRKLLEPLIIRLTARISENVDYYKNYLAVGSKEIKQVLLTGSVAKMEGLKDFIHEQAHFEVSIASPWANVHLDQKQMKTFSTDSLFYSYTTAIGLALKPNDT